MFEHVYETETVISAPRDQVFSFFADASNLSRLTPDSLEFRILSPTPIVMKSGALIEYALRLHGFPMRWRTRINSWNPPHSFSDEQLKGPYRIWLHQHTFEELGDRTRMKDQVRYALPFPPFGEVALPFVRREVRGIFEFRQKAILEVFPSD